VRSDQFFKGRHLSGLGVVETTDQNIGRIGKPVGPAEVCGGVRTEDGQRILPFHVPVGQVAPPAGADDDRSVRLGVDQDKADALVLRQTIQQAGIDRFYLFHACSLVEQRGIDQPEIARGQNDDVGSGVFRLARVHFLGLRAQVHATVSGASHQ